MFQEEFVGGDLRIRWQENPANIGVIEYLIIYQCETDKVSHTVLASEFQSEDETSGIRSYADTLTFSENTAAGLSRDVMITVKVRGADGLYADETEWLVVEANNPPPPAPHATFVNQFEAILITVTPPEATDLTGYEVHRGTVPNFTPDGQSPGLGTCVSVGPDTSITSFLPDSAEYYFKIAARDRFGPTALNYTTLGPASRVGFDIGDITAEVDAKIEAAEAEFAAQLAAEQAIREGAINGLNGQLTVINGKITLTNPEAGSIGSRFLVTESQSAGHSTRISGMENIVGLTDGSGLRARLFTAESTIADLETQKASSTRVTSLENELLAAREGQASLKANLDRMDQTVIDGLAEKASAQSVTSLNNEVTGARNGSANLKARIDGVLQTAIDGLALKASTTDLTNLSNEIVAAREGSPSLKAQLTSMRQTVVDGLALKASTTALNSLSNEITNARDGSATLVAKLNAMSQTMTDGLALKASATDMTTLQASVNVRNRTFRQNAAPTNPIAGYPLVAGDTWINTTAGQNNTLSVWTGAWTVSTDPRIATASQGVTDINAKIGTVSGTIADALTGKASASSVSSLDTKVNGFDARITSAQSAAVTADGKAEAKASFTLAAGNAITGWAMGASNGGSYIDFHTTNFRISNGTTAQAPFEIVGGVVRIKQAAMGTVSAGNITVGTLTQNMTVGTGAKIQIDGANNRILISD